MQYEAHYGVKLPSKKGSKKEGGDAEPKVVSKKTQKKYDERQKTKDVEQALADQFLQGIYIYIISSIILYMLVFIFL